MHHKIFFMTVFTVVIAGFGVMLLYKLNYLPQPIYDFLYQRLEPSSKSAYPYLEKFEGHWSVAFEPDVTGTDIVRCSSETGTFEVHNGKMTGMIGDLSGYISVLAQVDANGAVTGKTLRGSDEAGKVVAQLINEKGSGSWSDSLDCKGTIALKKIEAVVDPIQGKLISFGGSIKLLRSSIETDPLPGQLLYAGDTVEVPQGAKAYLSLGAAGQPVNLVGPTTYVVKAVK